MFIFFLKQILRNLQIVAPLLKSKVCCLSLNGQSLNPFSFGTLLLYEALFREFCGVSLRIIIIDVAVAKDFILTRSLFPKLKISNFHSCGVINLWQNSKFAFAEIFSLYFKRNLEEVRVWLLSCQLIEIDSGFIVQN